MFVLPSLSKKIEDIVNLKENVTNIVELWLEWLGIISSIPEMVKVGSYN